MLFTQENNHRRKLSAILRPEGAKGAKVVTGTSLGVEAKEGGARHTVWS